jgi:hypothetical protein
MATGTILLSPGSAMLPDGSASNLAPALLRFQGTEASPKKHFLVISYDGAGAKELAWWSFRMPTDYASAPILKIQWMANTLSAQSVVWSAQLGAITVGDTDTVLEHASAAASSATQSVNTSEARRLSEASITLANLDSVAAGDLVFLTIWRDSADASDTCTVDAELVGAALEYTST